MTKLKPCPFCKEIQLITGPLGYNVTCKCGLAAMTINWRKTKKEAINAWNKIYQINIEEKPRGMKTFDTKEKLEVVEILGEKMLFTPERITSYDIPNGYVYHLRFDDNLDKFATLEYFVAVNHAGSVISKNPIVGLQLSPNDYYEFETEDDYPNFTGDFMSFEEYMEH